MSLLESGRHEGRAEEERRLFDYFAVVGVGGDGKQLVELSLEAQAEAECGVRTETPKAPITEICVVFPSLGETVPEDYNCIETTPTGHAANLNHGSLPRTQSCFVCYRRGRHKPPLVDIGVLYEGKGESVMADSTVLKTTPFGRPANVNNAKDGIYLTYRRAPENSCPTLLAVMEISVILPCKGETPPHTFCRIPKNLNRGVVGSEVYICYKKSQANTTGRLLYKPILLDLLPRRGAERPLPPQLPMFCLPMGASLECWPTKSQLPAKVFLTFVLTDERGDRFYGAAVNFYERYSGTLGQQQLDRLGLLPAQEGSAGSVSDNSSTNDPAEEMSVYAGKSICVVGRQPFFVAFKRFLYFLHRIANSESNGSAIPVERYISHLMRRVPFPTARRPRVQVQIGQETIFFDSQAVAGGQLPASGGASLVDTLKSLGAENLIRLVLLALLEQKVLVHSLRPWMLTGCTEALRALLFPFHWQCPYIPQLPLDLAGVLHAPLPFIAGVDSRYFDLYRQPPADVTCVDLDTSAFSCGQSPTRLGLLPRKPYKLLKQTLEKLFHRICADEFVAKRQTSHYIPFDAQMAIQRRRRQIELGIQEAFLRFTASLMKGYQQHLRPIRSAPKIGSTDTTALFDLDGFLKSRDRSGVEFFRQFILTQSFNRFIEERSLMSDKNEYNAFFDDCVRRVDPSSTELPPNHHLLEFDVADDSRTVVVPPPEPCTKWKRHIFRYDSFPSRFNSDLFEDSVSAPNSVESLVIPTEPKSTLLTGLHCGAASSVRTKQETKLALKAVQRCFASPTGWAKCLLNYGYSLWFAALPAYLVVTEKKLHLLRIAFMVLDRMERARLPIIDEACGAYGNGAMAAEAHGRMERRGVRPNAITYAVYHRAVLESGGGWGAVSDKSAAQKRWTSLRLILKAARLFRGAGRPLRHERNVGIVSTMTGKVRTSLANSPPAKAGFGQHRHDSVAGLLMSSTLTTELNDSVFSPMPNTNSKTLDKSHDLAGFSNASRFAWQPGLAAGKRLFNAMRKGLGSSELIFGGSSASIFEQLRDEQRETDVSMKEQAFVVTADDSVVSSSPLSDTRESRRTSHEDDPLGVLSPNTAVEGMASSKKGTSPAPELNVSSSRAEFLKRHLDATPLFHKWSEEDGNNDSKLSSAAKSTIGSLFNRFGKSSVGRLIKSQTFGGDSLSASPEPPTGTGTATGAGDGIVSSLADELVSSPSINNLVNQASKFKEKVEQTHYKAPMGDAFQKQQPHIGKLRTSMSTVMNEMRNYYYNSPIQSSITSLSGEVSFNVEDGIDDDSCRFWEADTSGVFSNDGSTTSVMCNSDPAFALSRADAQLDLVSADNIVRLLDGGTLGAQTDDDELTEFLLLFTGCRCPNCEMVNYDEEVQAGWSPDESNLNTCCQFCQRPFVPLLSVQRRRPFGPSVWRQDSQILPTGGRAKRRLFSVGRSDSKQDCDDDNTATVVTLAAQREVSESFPYLSPLVLRKELENVMLANKTALASESFVRSHPIIFWNLIYLFRRLRLPSHFQSWLKSERRRTNEQEDRKSLLSLRCCADAAALHAGQPRCCTPLYYGRRARVATAELGDSPSALVSALLLDDSFGGVVSHSLQATSLLGQLELALAGGNLYQAIQLVLNERRKQPRPAGAGDQQSSAKALARHYSIYRDLFFLACVKFGRLFDGDWFDSQYAAAFEKLPPNVAAVLSKADRPPSEAVRACRKAFATAFIN